MLGPTPLQPGRGLHGETFTGPGQACSAQAASMSSQRLLRRATQRHRNAPCDADRVPWRLEDAFCQEPSALGADATPVQLTDENTARPTP